MGVAGGVCDPGSSVGVGWVAAAVASSTGPGASVVLGVSAVLGVVAALGSAAGSTGFVAASVLPGCGSVGSSLEGGGATTVAEAGSVVGVSGSTFAGGLSVLGVAGVLGATGSVGVAAAAGCSPGLAPGPSLGFSVAFGDGWLCVSGSVVAGSVSGVVGEAGSPCGSGCGVAGVGSLENRARTFERTSGTNMATAVAATSKLAKSAIRTFTLLRRGACSRCVGVFRALVRPVPSP